MIKWLLCAVAAFSAVAAMPRRTDTRWHDLLTEMYKEDRCTARQLVVEVKNGQLIFDLPRETFSSSYHALEGLLANHNFTKYFDFFRGTDLYRKMVKEITKDLNISPGQVDKMVLNMWSDYFRTESNGLRNWFTVYTEVRNGKLRKLTGKVVDQGGLYAVWFKTNDDTNVKRTFFHGTSPEFDLVSYTLCALQTSRSEESKLCSLELDENTVAVWVRTKHVKDSFKITLAEPRSVIRDAAVAEHQERRKNPANQDDFQQFVDKMWAADVDRFTESDLSVDWQDKVGSHGPMKKLFKFVNESHFEKPVYKVLFDIWEAGVFEPSVCKAELPVEGRKKQLAQAFFDTMIRHPIFKVALEYLQEKGKYEPASHDKFLNNLFTLWFGVYSRCHAPLGSSGFEHVFVGEKKGRMVDGHHNWVRFYTQEKRGELRYKGYYAHDDQLIGTIQYDWQDAHKEKGGFFFSTSPAFDFALYSTCVLTQSGSQHCRFRIKEFELFVTSFQQKCNEGTCISTSYAGIANV